LSNWQYQYNRNSEDVAVSLCYSGNKITNKLKLIPKNASITSSKNGRLNVLVNVDKARKGQRISPNQKDPSRLLSHLKQCGFNIIIPLRD